MTNQNKPLLVRFKDKGSMLSASRDVLKQCAERLGVTETTAVHIAINRLYMQIFPERVAEEAPTDTQLAKINAMNAASEKDPVVRKVSLADILA
jgi:hypothetical protein